MSAASGAPEELGGWLGLDTGGVSLTGKILGDALYTLYDSSGGKDSNGHGGCCADSEFRRRPRRVRVPHPRLTAIIPIS